MVKKLTVNLSGASAATAPVDTDINFNTLLSNIKENITDLTINLSDSGTTDIVNVFSVNNLTIDYSSNGLNDS